MFKTISNEHIICFFREICGLIPKLPCACKMEDALKNDQNIV